MLYIHQTLMNIINNMIIKNNISAIPEFPLKQLIEISLNDQAMNDHEGVMNQYASFCYLCRARSFENKMTEIPDVPYRRVVCPDCRSELSKSN